VSLCSHTGTENYIERERETDRQTDGQTQHGKQDIPQPDSLLGVFHTRVFRAPPLPNNTVHQGRIYVGAGGHVPPRFTS